MYNITLIPGDGIGPEVINAAKRIIDSTGLKINWDIQEAGANALSKHGTLLPDSLISSIKNNKLAFKGPITTPIGGGFRSVNVSLRQALDLYANVRPCKNYAGIKSRYENIDLIVVRENTEDIYCGKDYMVDKDTAESVKVITRKGSERIVRYAFELAKKESRKKVTAVHKANIMKCTDGMFLNTAREVASEYTDIIFEEMIVDAMCMKLVQAPENYDVMVMPNLYGDIISDLCSGLIGGLGITPSGNIGLQASVFEPVHGSAPDIAGKGIANPTAAILSGCMMLRHIGEIQASESIENILSTIFFEGKFLTQDLGGSLSTDEFADEIIQRLEGR